MVTLLAVQETVKFRMRVGYVKTDPKPSDGQMIAPTALTTEAVPQSALVIGEMSYPEEGV